jgi:hypothetical protein
MNLLSNGQNELGRSSGYRLTHQLVRHPVEYPIPFGAELERRILLEIQALVFRSDENGFGVWLVDILFEDVPGASSIRPEDNGATI